MTGDELAAAPGRRRSQLLDVRSPAEYDGSAGYPCDPVQGHIPGAVNVDVSEIADAGADVRALLAERGDRSDAPIVCYCHSGSRSAYAAAACSPQPASRPRTTRGRGTSGLGARPS